MAWFMLAFCQEGSEGHLVNRLGWKNGQNNMMIRNGRMLRITKQFLQGYHCIAAEPIFSGWATSAAQIGLASWSGLLY